MKRAGWRNSLSVIGLIASCLLLIFGVFAGWPKLQEQWHAEHAKEIEHNRLLLLFKEASGIQPYVHSSSDSTQAVEKIGASPGQEAEQMLIDLATHQPTGALLNVQVQAVKELQKRDDP